MAGSNLRRLLLGAMFAAALAALSGCHKQAPADTTPAVAVSNSYLASALRDIAGPDLTVVSLAPPGMCPGHFDIRPSQVDQIRRCRLFLRFDFQKGLDTQLRDLTTNGLTIHQVHADGSLNEPATYLAACRQTAEALLAGRLADPAAVSKRLTDIERQLDALTRQVHAAVKQADLTDRPVLCSHHQEGFCRWLGLNVVDTFAGSDSTSLAQMDRAIQAARQANVTLVIANKPEGRGAADALADRLGAKVIVFDNFPAEPLEHATYQQMLQANVAGLTGVGHP